jgi:hypothetical protein
VLAALLASTAGVLGCFPEQPAGASGVKARVVFQTPELPTVDAGAFFQARLVVGSGFAVAGKARVDDDRQAVAGALFQSSDPSILVVEENVITAGRVKLIAPGSAELRVMGGDGLEIDHLVIEAARPKKQNVLDDFFVSSSIDARIPTTFGMVRSTGATLRLGATDRCEGGLLDVGATTMTSSDETIVKITPNGVAGFDLSALEEGEVTVTVEGGGVEPVTLTVKVVDSDFVNVVQPLVATGQDNTATLWARAFAGELELLGITFGWTSDPRVALSAQNAAVVTATIEQPVEGAPPDERPATVTARAFGTEGTVDLFAVTGASIVTSRVDDDGTDATNDTSAATTGCANPFTGAGCDPFAAVLLPALGLGRLRRRRTA